MSRRARWLVGGLLVAIALLVALVGVSDLRELGDHVAGMSWAVAVIAAAASVVSYVAGGLAQGRLLVGLGHRVPTATAVRAVMLSTVVNRMIRSGGASGVVTLAWLLRAHAVPVGAAVVTVLACTLLINTLFTTLFLSGVAVLGWQALAERGGGAAEQVTAYALAAAAFTAFLVGAWTALAHPRARRAWMRWVVRIAERTGRRVGRPHWGPRTRAFLDTVAERALELLVRRREGWQAWGWLVVRLLFSVSALWLCFHAFDTPLGVGVLVLGYTAGKAAGVLSFIPAGLGLVEGSMVAVFVALGVDYEAALAAALLNRVVYHLVPALVALAAAGPLVRGPFGSAGGEPDASPPPA